MLTRFVLLFGVSSLLGGCGSLNPFKWFGARATTDSIGVVAEPNANRNTATALDIVFIYDKTVLSLLPKTGPEWFARKQELTSGNPDKIEVVSVQIPPSMVIDSVALPAGHDIAVGVVVYANYLGKDGQYPGDLTSFKRSVIRLKPETIEYQKIQ